MSTLTVANLMGPGSSPVLTVTPPSSDNSTAIATTAFVRSYVSTLSPGFPFTLGVTPIGPTSITTALSGISLDACPIGQSSPGIATFTSLSSSAVNLTGGTINGIVIGGTTPAAATFTTLIANTPSGGDNSTKAATTAFVQAAITAATGRLLSVRVFSTVGTTTYTPTAGTTSVIVEAMGGGASGVSTSATSAGQWSSGNGGQAGAYGKGRYTSAFSGVTITVGAGGAGLGTANTSNAGGSSSFGALLVCPGGAVGPANMLVSVSTSSFNSTLTTQPTATGANIVSVPGLPGLPAFSTATQTFSGRGACTLMGTGGAGITGNLPGNAGVGYGSGGSGGTAGPSQAVQAGGAGAQGVVIVYEYA